MLILADGVVHLPVCLGSCSSWLGDGNEACGQCFSVCQCVCVSELRTLKMRVKLTLTEWLL